MKVCSFCDETKPNNEIRLTYDEESLVCKYINECEGLKDE